MQHGTDPTINRPNPTTRSKLIAAALATQNILLNGAYAVFAYGLVWQDMDMAYAAMFTILLLWLDLWGLPAWIHWEFQRKMYSVSYPEAAHIRWWTTNTSLIAACTHAAVGVLLDHTIVGWLCALAAIVLSVIVAWVYPAYPMPKQQGGPNIFQLFNGGRTDKWM